MAPGIEARLADRNGRTSIGELGSSRAAVCDSLLRSHGSIQGMRSAARGSTNAAGTAALAPEIRIIDNVGINKFPTKVTPVAVGDYPEWPRIVPRIDFARKTSPRRVIIMVERQTSCRCGDNSGANHEFERQDFRIHPPVLPAHK
jgi:hypothetical protein